MDMKNASLQSTTILSVRKGNDVVIAADGQVSLESLIIKTNVRKIRRLTKGNVIVGFTGSTADALTLFERLEEKLEQNPHQLLRPCVDLVREWRKDPLLRSIHDMLVVINPRQSLILTSSGEVFEPDDGLVGVGIGGAYALSAARALIDVEGYDAKTITEKSMKIAADICVYTNSNLTIESIEH
jgi:ATP-dependent HslUV protease subunit HslV